MKKFSPEFIEKAKKARTSEELIVIAKENDIELNAKQAGALLVSVNTGELSDDDLDAAVGGTDLELDLRDRFHNDPNLLKTEIRCPYCGGEIGKIQISGSNGILFCTECGRSSLKDTLGFPGFTAGF